MAIKKICKQDSASSKIIIKTREIIKTKIGGRIKKKKGQIKNKIRS